MLLLDEPLSALDAKVRAQLRDEIRRVQLEVGTTTLFVTHDQEEALAVADRVGVMNAGRLEQIAPPAELYAHPASRFVAEFVGLSNRVPAEVLGGTAHACWHVGPGDRRVDRLGPGVAFVRPESVTVTADADGTATVASVGFLGPISRIYPDLPDGQHLMAQVPSSAAAGLSPGDRVPGRHRPHPRAGDRGLPGGGGSNPGGRGRGKRQNESESRAVTGGRRRRTPACRSRRAARALPSSSSASAR